MPARKVVYNCMSTAWVFTQQEDGPVFLVTQATEAVPARIARLEWDEEGWGATLTRIDTGSGAETVVDTNLGELSMGYVAP